MPGTKGGLTKPELKEYKKRLEQMRNELLNEYHQLSKEVLSKSQTDASGDLSSHALHIADVATDTYERDFSIDLAANEMGMVAEIEHALHKIGDGTFGVCENCGKPIPKTRLEAIPYVPQCKKCSELDDKENNQRVSERPARSSDEPPEEE